MLLFARCRVAVGAAKASRRCARAGDRGLLLALLATSCRLARTHGAFEIRLQETEVPARRDVRPRPPAGDRLRPGRAAQRKHPLLRRTVRRCDGICSRPTGSIEVVATLRAEGFEPFVVVDGGEDEEFRRRFGDAGQQAVRGLTLAAVLGDARVYGLK